MAEAPQTVDRSKAAGEHSAGGPAERPQAPEQQDGATESKHAPARDDERAARDAPSGSQPAGAGTGPDASEEAGEQPAAKEADADEGALRKDVDELMAAAAQRDEYLALAQRTQADFENYRKRVAKESAAAQQRGMARLAQELLPALDNLDRALEAASQGDGELPLLEGVRLVRAELHAALARMGIESFSPHGAPFDPAEHEAMASKPCESSQSGTVVEVFAPGYRLGKHIIRPARVLVAA